MAVETGYRVQILNVKASARYVRPYPYDDKE